MRADTRGRNNWLRRRIGGNRDGTGRFLDRHWFVWIGNHWRIAGRNRRIRQCVYVQGILRPQRPHRILCRTASKIKQAASRFKRMVDRIKVEVALHLGDLDCILAPQ
jgi:hypothetical protein